MKALLAIPFVEVGELLGNVWCVIKLLAGSRKAILVALASTLSLLVVAIPELEPYRQVVYDRVDVFLGILVVILGLIDVIKANAANQGTAG